MVDFFAPHLNFAAFTTIPVGFTCNMHLCFRYNDVIHLSMYISCPMLQNLRRTIVVHVAVNKSKVMQNYHLSCCFDA